MKKSAVILAVLILGTARSGLANKFVDAGAQMRNTLDLLERARVEQQIEQDRNRRHEQVQKEKTPGELQAAEKVEFVVKKFEYDKSQVLTEQQLAELTGEYVNKTVTIDDLNKLVGRINGLYAKGGYVTCKAFLPPQKVTGGVVKILLVEGRTGKVNITNNKDTEEKYIRRRVPIETGKVVKISELERLLKYFNITNDVQLRVTLKAGEQKGTTDFDIVAYEPQKFNHTFFTDNAGSENSGEYRYGYFFNIRSLCGIRDSLTMGTIISKGSTAWSAVYDVPVSPSGTKVSLAYSGNSVEMIDGELKDAGNDTKGHSCAYSVALRQPWVVNETTRSEVGLEFNHQSSNTDIRQEGMETMVLVDDFNRDLSPYFSHTTYGKSHVFYQKHAYAVYGQYDSGTAENNNLNHMQYYKFNAIYQKGYQHRQSIIARVDAQKTWDSKLPSSRRFYIGGMNSVRGYKESYLCGDSGFTASLEYQVPISRDYIHNLFCFWDFGYANDSYFNDRIIQSLGMGIKSSWNKHIYSTLSIAFPLVRDLNEDTVSRTRVHYMLSWVF